MDSNPRWTLPTERPFLRDDEVHVWRAFLDLPRGPVHWLEKTLSEDEQQRASRFYFLRDRIHFIVARGTLRVILSSYLSAKPGEVRFRYGSYGKPELIIESCNEELCFNVSHSHGLALYAISLNRQVGVDIERLRSDFSVDLVARQFFSKRENLALSAMAPNEKLQAFFACWTRKEAYIKAKGKGLSIPLDQFDVSINPKDLESPLRIHGDPLESCRWSLQSLNPGHGYFAAVAAEKRRWRLKCWQWHPESMERPGTPVPAKECGK